MARISFVATVSNSTINGGPVTLALPSSIMRPNDYVLVTGGLPNIGATLGVTSSSTSTTYTQLLQFNSTVASSSYRFGVFRRIMPAAVETQAICSGTASSSDATAYVAMILRSVSTSTPEDVTATSSSGTGTTPNSPSITQTTSNASFVSCVGSAVSDAAVTAPSSWLNAISINGNDVFDTTVGMVWLQGTSTSSTSPMDPASWSAFVSGSWASATVALRPDLTIESVWDGTQEHDKPRIHFADFYKTIPY